jgi:hypothetical protein
MAREQKPRKPQKQQTAKTSKTDQIQASSSQETGTEIQPSTSKIEEQPRTRDWVIFWMHFVSEVCRLLWWVLLIGGVNLGIYLAITLPVRDSAGKNTQFFVLQDWALSFRIDLAICVSISLVTTGWALWERKMRLRERKEKDARLAKFEKAKDPGRTSSGLDTEGEREI